MNSRAFVWVMGLMVVIGITVVLAPQPVSADATCGTTRMSGTVSRGGLQFHGVSNKVVNGTNTLVLSVKNVTTATKNFTVKKFHCRCQQHLGEPGINPGVCGHYWDPSSNPACITTSQHYVLGAGASRTIQASVAQYNGQACGSFQLDFALTHVDGKLFAPNNLTQQFVGASFTDMCVDCAGANNPPPSNPALSCPGNLISNGDFENPTIVNPKTQNLWQVYGGASHPQYYDAQPAIPGWNPTGPYQVELQANGLFGSAATGRQYAEIDDPGSVRLTQAVSTAAGGSYQLSFSYAPRPDAGTQAMGVYWNGQLIGTVGGTGNGSNTFIPWQLKTFTLNSASGSNTLGFGSTQGMQGAGNFIDSVCLQQVNVSQPTLTVSCSASPNPVNTDQGVSFASNVSGGTGSYTYNWSGACTGSNSSCSTAFSFPGTKTSTVTVTSGTQSASASCSVNVNTLPPPTLTASCIASPNPANTNQTVNFIPTVSGGTGSYTYTWTNACSGFSQNCSTSFSDGGTKTAMLAVTSGNQTVNTSCQVNVNQVSNLQVSCVASPSQIDTNQTTTFIPTVSGGSGSYTYNWSGACTGTSSNCTNTFNSSGTKTATVTVTSGNQSQTANCSVNVNQTNNLSVSCYATPNPANVNQQVAFIASASGGSGNYTYNWQGACTGSSSTCYNSFGSNNNSYTASVTVNSDGQTASTSCTVSTNQSNAANLTLTKQVRNLSTGNLTWTNSVNASPSDIVQFQVTIRASSSGQSINNVTISDVLPANLIYKNALTVDGVSQIGSITGLNIGGITSGQTRILTYQAQVAPAQNFAFGTTTLTNAAVASTTSLGYGTSNTASASVVVTRTGVQGATDVSTGLTNNFWIDSFFLPMLLALAGLWLYKSRIIGVPAWVGTMQARNRNTLVAKKLESRITQIRKQERI